jgi:uncharacterized BrkB/YihY/UPF0761 family membrane protein
VVRAVGEQWNSCGFRRDRSPPPRCGLIVSLGFKWYVFHFGHYQKTYGAIGGVMVALLWFYFSGLAILLGAQLNATIDRASQPAVVLKVA